ncbi:MAG TPA: amidase [Burkholderiales bacterium]|nr:amidase [Burkholderiales bacterium]
MEFPLTLAEAARRVETRAISPVELVRAALDRIEAFDGRINAFNTIVAERALEQARAAEREIGAGRYRGPLHGIPFGAKDIYDTAGILTSGYSRAFFDNVPANDATVIAKLYASGAVLAGKLATHELANGGPSFDLPWPPARNPWNTEHATGGSSTGAAAAVAAGFLPAALGSDTGGSIRIPAAQCGVAGLKPTYGRVSRAGVIPHSFSLDHCGPLAWTVEDCAIVLQAIAGYDPLDLASINHPVPDYRSALDGDIRGLRIGVVRHFWEEDLAVSPEVSSAMDAALATLAGVGARIETVRVPPLQRFYDVKNVIAKCEVFTVHRQRLVERLDDFGADFLALTLPGCLFSATDYLRAQAGRRALIEAMSAIHERCDAIVTAGSGPAPKLRATSATRAIDHWTKPNLETPFSVTGAPAIAVCNGYTAGGLPLAMQIAGRAFDESTVLRIAHAYERATPWRDRRPMLDAAGDENQGLTPKKPGADPVHPATRERVAKSLESAGLTLDEERFAQLCTIAPIALDAARRVGRERS